MFENGTILLPVAGKSSRFPNMRPKWLLTAPTGELMLAKALNSIPSWRECRVVIGALATHLTDFGGEKAIRKSFGNHPEIVVFNETTRGPAETVAEMIRMASVSGPIFIKDCDSWFETSQELFSNCVCVASLQENPETENIAAKSFVQTDYNNIISGIFEKTVCSDLFSVGGYGFSSAAAYLQFYSEIIRDNSGREPFVSHVILAAIAGGDVFQAKRVEWFEDVGTAPAWQKFRDKHSVYVLDIDGVVFKNAGEFSSHSWDAENDIPLTANVNRLKSIQKNGGQFIFMTARHEKYREKTERALKACGLTWHALICGVNHAKRILVNDFAASNPYPSAVAINIPRDQDNLDDFVQ